MYREILSAHSLHAPSIALPPPLLTMTSLMGTALTALAFALRRSESMLFPPVAMARTFIDGDDDGGEREGTAAAACLLPVFCLRHCRWLWLAQVLLLLLLEVVAAAAAAATARLLPRWWMKRGFNRTPTCASDVIFYMCVRWWFAFTTVSCARVK